MSEHHSTAPAEPDKRSEPVATGKPAKPSKPYPEYPLTAHPAGQWCKKIRGKVYYFGVWGDPGAALDSYLAQKDDLHAGRKPREDTEALTVKGLCNQLLHSKQALVDNGELCPRTWDDYKEVCDLLVAEFGKGRLVADLGPDDFAALRSRMAKRWGPVRLGNGVQRVRTVFKFAADNRLIDRPVCYGQGFDRPSAKTLRKHRAARGAKLFTAGEVRRLIDAAGVQLRAQVLLGINCGFGMADCGRLPLSALDLDRGWIDYPRPKTGIPRRCPLWPETVEAIRQALAARPKPKRSEDAELVFLTAQGNPWHKEDASSPAVWVFKKLMNALGINGRKGLGFYTLRHTFRTVADEAKDQPAADFIMGHEVPHMSAVYRETISDARLRAVADHVRAWLFAESSKPAPGGGSAKGAGHDEEE
jgi:integrase